MKSADTRPAGAGRAAVPRRGGETQDFLTGLRRDTLRRWASSALYRYTLIGRTPTDLLVRIGERWPGEAKRGEALLRRQYRVARRTGPQPGSGLVPAHRRRGMAGGLARVHLAPGSDERRANARDAARALVQSWLRENARWHPVAWRADVLATRLFAWIVHLDEIAAGRPIAGCVGRCWRALPRNCAISA